MTAWGAKKRLFVYDWRVSSPAESFAPLADCPYSLFFDSAREGHPLSRYSYLCWHPFETIEAKDGQVTIRAREQQFTTTGDVFQVIRERVALWAETHKPQKNLPPFQGGAAGFFGYDLARTLESLPSRAAEHAQQDLCIGLYDRVIAFDHHKHKAWLMIYAEEEAEAHAQRDFLERMVKAHKPASYTPAALPWTTKTCDANYEGDIKRVIDYIHAGDIFQANLSRRFSAKLPQGFNSYAHYTHMRQVNPAPYGAYMNFGGLTLASTSPEQFLSVQGRTAETRPIKGTMPSSAPASALADSEKDRAENIMIVDLLRNDLSKVCEDHSVEVAKLCGIETFEGLHHMVSTVRGTLRADQSACDALRACFPGGSITGAPKIRAMEIIDTMEPDRRGAYCGAMGWIGFDGAMDTAITIRTLVYTGGEVQLQTGGGITAQSSPHGELEETLVKAMKLFESFETAEPALKRA